MADIVASSIDGTGAVLLKGCRLDVEFGDSGANDIELTVGAASGQRVAMGSVVYVDGTEYGGIVDSSESDSREGAIRYAGRSWHGILAGKIVCPPSGQDHRTADGEANACILQIIGLLGLSGVMTASAGDSGVEIQGFAFDRFCDGYAGLRKMLASAGARLAISYDSRSSMAVLSAVPIVDWTAGIDSDMAGVEVKRVHRTVNHLISLGEGEGAARIVRHDYADEDGAISQVQTLFGVDEIAMTYDYGNADAARLAEAAPERLSELMDGDSLKASLDGAEWEYAVGDVVPGTDIDTGESVRVEVGTKIAVATDDGIEIEYRAGDASPRADVIRAVASGMDYQTGRGTLWRS